MEKEERLSRPIRVLIVDDSAVIRSIIERSLKSSADIQVVGFAANGEAAISSLVTCNPDIVILDIEMPVMDGITALPLILKKKPDVKVIICSTLSDAGAAVSIRALSLGALECILKPSGPEAIQQNAEFHERLVRTVLTLGRGSVASSKPAPASVALRKAPLLAVKPRVLAIGSSTGGPNALMELLKPLNGLPVPIVITQHMPKTFTAILAGHIQQATGIPTEEASNDAVLQPGKAYVAAGGFHMLFKERAGGTMIQLDHGPMESFCRPAVDPMLRSLVGIYGGKILTVILTGMGSDGLLGAQEVARAGGQVIAQDQETSVVWGMPGAVANAGICSTVAPIPKLADWILKTFKS